MRSFLLSICLWIVCCGINTNVFSQGACTIANANIQYKCIYDQYAVGVFTTVGSTYTWYLNGTKKKGPVPGNGDAISYSFEMASQADAGQYVVEKTTPGFPNTCVYNELIIINEDVAGLHTNSITANSVSFGWTSTGKCDYYVTPDPSPRSDAITAASTNGTGSVTGLSGGTTYYIHVRPDCDYYAWETLSFTTSPGPCTTYTSQSTVYGGGTFCFGSNVDVSITNSRTDQQYTWLRDGIAIYGPIAGTGTGTLLTYTISFNSAAQAGTYKVRVSKAGCTSQDLGNQVVSYLTPTTGVISSNITEVTADFNWNASGNSNGYDYDFTTTSTPPTSPRFTSSGNSITLTDLSPTTSYYFHVRPRCGFGGSPTPPAWTSIQFTTLAIAPINCSAITALQVCTPVVASIPKGGGPWNLAGSYPNNSVGNPTPGKELLYSFTPATTGVYYVDVTAGNNSYISYFYKKNSSSACSPSGWIGIRNNFGAGKFPIGMLQAGVSYVFLLDGYETLGATQTFAICKATVGSPSSFNTCLSTSYSPSIPPYSSKEEFVIDAQGNLIASIDYSKSPLPSGINLTYSVNNQAIRHDDYAREYFDRNYYFYGVNVKIKLFFTNAELQRLINEPNDGNADVNSINDLGVTAVSGYCEDGLASNSGSFIAQSGNGVYDANSSYITIEGSSYGNLFINGGNTGLNNFPCPASQPNYYSIPYSEVFNNAAIPSCWWETQFGSSLAFKNNEAIPAIPDFEGSRYLFYNSAAFAAGTSTILNVLPVNTTGVSSVDAEFYWYLNNNPANTSSIEGVQIEYSLDNSNFTWAGFIQRHDGSLAAGTGKWKKMRITLPAAAANKPALFVRLIFFSQHGDNCAMDAFSITQTDPCSEVTNLRTTSLTSNEATISWTNPAGVTSCTYTLLSPDGQSTGLTQITGNSFSKTNLSPGTTYKVTVWPMCSPGIMGEEYTILFTTPGAACSGSNIVFSTPYNDNFYNFKWQVDMGSGFTDISNNAIYSGATTSTLTIIAPPSNYSGYKYRCLTMLGNSVSYMSQTKDLIIGSSWTGVTSNNWNTASNWSCGVVPDANTNVVIQPGTPNNPMISSTTANCKSITIKTGAVLNIAPGFKLTITQ